MVIRLYKFLIGLVLGSLVLVNPAQANLIVNGSFELPAVQAGSFTNFLSGSTAISGWTVVGIDSSLVSTSFQQSGITFEAQDGNQWIDLAGVTSNSKTSGVTQDVSTVVGAQYLLSFYVGSATDGRLFFPTTIDLSIDGGARTHFTNSTAPSDALDWQLFTVNFTASSSLTAITFFNGSESNNFLSGLDTVSLTAVPLPGAFALMAAGNVLLLALFQRRNVGR